MECYLFFIGVHVADNPSHDRPKMNGTLTRIDLLLPKCLYILVGAKAFSRKHTILFLEHLRRQAGKCLLVLLDGSPIHRWDAIPEYFASGAAKTLHGEPLPGYAPNFEALGPRRVASLETCRNA